MSRVLIFGGTTEGRILAEFCACEQMAAVVCVTTDYGAELLQKSEYVQLSVGKKDAEGIRELLSKEQELVGANYRFVLDATHPYAKDASRNILKACEDAKVAYYRVLRPDTEKVSWGRYFDSLEELIEYLNDTEGRIFVTTGSKELPRLCGLKGYEKRCVTRFLPNKEIQETCRRLGYREEWMIPMKGPFSVEQNVEHLRMFDVKYLVTKDSGAVGGFDEKAEAARQCGAELLVLRRPKEQGITTEEAMELLKGIRKRSVF